MVLGGMHFFNLAIFASIRHHGTAEKPPALRPAQPRIALEEA